MKELLGVVPPDDASGCLQDVHWSAGLFGYFPSYALGNLYAAQFWVGDEEGAARPRGANRSRRPRLASSPGFAKNVHAPGATYLPGELLERVTGSRASIPPISCAYLDEKYSRIYGF